MTEIVAEHVDLFGAKSVARANVMASVHAAEHFEADGIELAFDHMQITKMSLAPMQVTAGDSPSQYDLVTVFFVIDGAFTVISDLHKYRFTPGSAAFLSNRTVVSVQSNCPTRVASITFLREVLDQHGVTLPAEFGSFAYSTCRVSPALRYVLDLVDVASHSPVQAEPVEATLVQLITELFTEDREYYAAS